MTKTILLAAALVAPLVPVALAGHANPWSGAEDDLNMQYHEENLAQSIDTPGEDEMLGEMVQGAFGKLGGDRPGAGGPGMVDGDTGAGNGGPGGDNGGPGGGGSGGNGGPGGRQ